MFVKNCSQLEYERFERIWQEARNEYCGTPCGAMCSTCAPPPWVVAQILNLYEKHDDRPVGDLAPMVRSILEESRFAGDAGDVLSLPQYHPKIERQVNLAIATLGQIRRSALAQVG